MAESPGPIAKYARPRESRWILPIAHADTLGCRVRGTVTIGPIFAVEVCSAASVIAT